MGDYQIEKLDEFIRENISEQTEILEKTLTNLTAPGENYWSEMLRLNLTLRNKETGVIEELDVCVKCVVAEEFQAAMNVGMFKTEIQFYKVILPLMQKYLKDKGLPELTFFPEMIGGRLNLENQGDPDKNAFLILENLKTKGYQNLDRHEGFDLEAAQILVGDLAAFHAIPLAIRLHDPQTFREKIVDNCMVFRPPPLKDGKGPPLPPYNLMRSILKEDPFCRNHLDVFDKLEELNRKKMESGRGFTNNYEGNFMTLNHHDMWINNTMQIVEEGKVVKNVFLDFQMIGTDNPAVDLLMFLFTSVSVSALQNHFDYLLSIYHQKFINTLESLGCDTEQFAYKHFLKILRMAVTDGFMHTNLMNLTVIFAKKGQKHDWNKNDQIKPEDVHPVAKAKLWTYFSEIVKKNWF